ncbi:hypothetical protein RLEG12_05350 (plasmid) [Rhizobium leguminosarum bv. trifolii CB782]|nr:hypothetical protein RLEG12_05350 [Rhizobium leguminosarum bv. trifolii CB782]
MSASAASPEVKRRPEKKHRIAVEGGVIDLSARHGASWASLRD